MHLLLGTGLSGDVLEGDAEVVALLIHLRLRLADVEDASSAAHTASHAVEQEVHQDEEEQEWANAIEEVLEHAGSLVVVAEVDEESFLLHLGEVLVELVG